MEIYPDNQTGVHYSKICYVLWVCMLHGIFKKLANIVSILLANLIIYKSVHI